MVGSSNGAGNEAPTRSPHRRSLTTTTPYLAGPPGAGKSSAHEHLFSGGDRTHWRELDSDVFKGYLLEAAIDNGSLQEMLPENLRVSDHQGYFYPNELSALVHHESTDLVATAAKDVIGRGDNLAVRDGAAR
ncbi:MULTISPECIES: hypothetical protein [unclassified Rhodococcus (in: high G+C Gram-positive bacteria)]|jgi:hypothetical protein|uniref:hypothetical protein n=1 Tax=unclassified Rhodococcus (in: high G+C Gram-positive bacteria) TaxID=192944 RepID=UPI000BC5CF1C|nr:MULTISPECIES: hypothetical protein [unclassified Rhodococcus (in: high G+C Gram-positive bacteria)]MBP1157967.1 hypothetical protein [Rhodococcus sp. PvR099]PTR37796.1 hypothetical protein C8K38_11946 [Rhodococcus sp. OK611]SNX93227.1 hypothetical protein SAMN05447004_11946 [Rhodococcus sp. OK270]